MTTRLCLFLLLAPLLGAQIDHRGGARPGGKDYALFFACETYDHAASWKTLPGLIDECEAIKKDLIDRYGFSDESKVVRNPDLAQIKAELARWRSRAYGPDDQLLVFFSGHGQFLESLQEGFFIPRDGKPGKDAGAEQSWYSLLQMPRHINTIGCRHILLAIDACYSGTIDNRVALKWEEEEWAKPQKDNDAQFHQFIHDRLANKSRILMTSGGKTRTRHPSDFVRYFREALAALGGADRLVTPAEIEDRWPPVITPDRPLSGLFEGHEPGGTFLMVYQAKNFSPAPPPAQDADFDDDGVKDKDDKCPTERGTAAAKGCPDRDDDGVADKFDSCPDAKGPATNDGCPPTDPFSADMVYAMGGKFNMGSNEYDDEKPIHEVELDGFYLARYEVTQAQWRAVMGADPPDLYFKNCDQCPVEGVSWNDIQEFIQRLNAQTGKTYRLPTEAEWEYAARGGVKSKGYTYAGGNNLGEAGWYGDNSESKTHPVGQKSPNELGLYDMSGNVWEWCADWYGSDYYSQSARKNPTGPNTGSYRVSLGGSWNSVPQVCRAADRDGDTPDTRYINLGFRLARTP